jgi:hypothetical protein
MTDNNNNGDGKGFDRDDELVKNITEELGGAEAILDNPFEVMQKLMSKPELMQQLNGLFHNPKMKEQIEAGFNNPFFKQIMSSNPQLDALYQKTQAMRNAESWPFEQGASSDKEPEQTEAPVDSGMRIDWLQAPHTMNSLVLPSDENFVRFKDIFSKLSSENREKIEILAAERLSYHLPMANRDRLEDIAETHGVTALDLMSNVAGFLGDVLYFAATRYDLKLVDAIKEALSGVRKRSGYPVPSYLTQHVLRLEHYDACEESDWENLVWALSANPKSGIDGNFSIHWQDVQLLVEMASASLDSPTLLLGVILGLLQWDELGSKSADHKLSTLISLCPKEKQSELLPYLLELMIGKRFYGVGLRKSSPISLELLNYLISRSQFETLLTTVAQNSDDVWELIHENILQKLDLLWSSLDNDIVNTYLLKLVEGGTTELMKKAIQTGFAWEPERYREIALTHSDDAIVQWAKSLSMKVT